MQDEELEVSAEEVEAEMADSDAEGDVRSEDAEVSADAGSEVSEEVAA